MTDELVARRTVHEGRVVSLHVDTVALAKGGTVEREVVEHRGAVVLVPLVGADVLLVRQHRHAVGKALLELPAGTLGAGEDVQAAARRELAEETGFVPGRLEPLGAFWPSPGFCTERMTLFRALDLAPGPLPPDDDEDIEVVRVPLADAQRWARAGELEDMKTVVGLLLV